MLVIGSAVPVAAGGRARRLHTVSGRLCSSRTSGHSGEASSAHSTSCGQR